MSDCKKCEGLPLEACQCFSSVPKERPVPRAWLWFGGKSGWQVTTFDPRDDKAIGFKGDDISIWVNQDYYHQETARLRQRALDAEDVARKSYTVAGQWKALCMYLAKHSRLAFNMLNHRGSCRVNGCQICKTLTHVEGAIVRIEKLKYKNIGDADVQKTKPS